MPGPPRWMHDGDEASWALVDVAHACGMNNVVTMHVRVRVGAHSCVAAWRICVSSPWVGRSGESVLMVVLGSSSAYGGGSFCVLSCSSCCCEWLLALVDGEVECFGCSAEVAVLLDRWVSSIANPAERVGRCLWRWLQWYCAAL